MRQWTNRARGTSFAILALLALSPLAVLGSQKSKFITINEAPVSIPRAGTKRLFISGFNGQILITPNSNRTDITLRATKSIDTLAPGVAGSVSDKLEILHQMIVKTSASRDTIEVHVQSSPSRSDWLRWVDGKQSPQVRLEIQAPDSMNLEIYWTHGDVRVSDWHGSITLINQEGHHLFGNLSGDLALKTMFGSVKIINMSGNVSIDNFSSTLAIANLTGKLALRTFSGDTKLKKIVGPVNLGTQKAAISTQDTNGALTVQTGMGPINILAHRGALSGIADSGLIDANILGPVNTKLSSESGPLIVRIPHQSQARVSMTTEKGNVHAPNVLENRKTASGKTVRGKLNGNEPGSVKMTSESGDLSLKFL